MSTDLAKFDLASPLGSLDTYIAWAQKMPMLTAEEEKELTERLFNHNDLEAARRLILSHLRFVIRIARGYNGYGLAQGDLIQEGNVGLMKAVKRFDPKIGVRLVSFAVHWIKAEIHEFIIRNWRVVKIATTKAQRKLFFNLRKAAKNKRLSWFTNDEVDAVAKDLNVSAKEVRHMEMRLNTYDAAFDGPTSTDSDSDESYSSPANYLESKQADPAKLYEDAATENNLKHNLQDALMQIDERSRDILARRWLAEKKATLHELADEYKISAERIRQLEKQAMVKLKSFMTDNDAGLH